MSSITDRIAEENVERAGKLAAAIAQALGILGLNTAKAAGRGIGHGLTEGIRFTADTYNKYHFQKPTGEVNKEFLMKACQKLNEKSSHINVANTEVEQMKNLLKQEGIMFAVWDIPGDNGKVFQFLNTDREKVLNAIDMMRGSAIEFGRVAPAVLGADIALGDKVGAITGLTPAELALFEHFAPKNKLRYAVADDGEKGQMVMFRESDAEAARRTSLDVGWMIGGPDGARVREQLVYHLEGFEMMQLSLKEAQEEAYFCCKDDPNRFVHVTPEGYSLHHGDDVVHTISRDNLYFERQAVADILSISDAVYLSKAQFNSLARDEEDKILPDELAYEHTMSLFPEDFDESKEMAALGALMAKARDHTDATQDKRGLDNEGNTIWGAGDTSVSKSCFSGMEHLQDIDDAERKRASDAAAFAAQHEPTMVERSQRSLDEIISDAKTRSDEQFVQSMGRSRRTEREK